MSATPLGSANGTTSPQTITAPQNVPVGSILAVVVMRTGSNAITVTDARGNAYTLRNAANPGGGMPAVFTTSVATQINTGDAWTITSTTPGSMASAVLLLNGVSDPVPDKNVVLEMAYGSVASYYREWGFSSVDDALVLGAAMIGNAYQAHTVGSGLGLTEHYDISINAATRGLAVVTRDITGLTVAKINGSFAAAASQFLNVSLTTFKKTAGVAQIPGFSAPVGPRAASFSRGNGGGGVIVPTQGQLWPRGNA